MGDLQALIDKTKDTLGKIITKPKLTDKLLSKPPVRFLQDIIKAVLGQSRFGEGLFTAEELDASFVKEKESKIKFLGKAISCVSYTLGEPVPARPQKIVTGSEAENTNIFLHMLYRCVVDDMDSTEAVQRVLNEAANPKSEGSRSKSRERPGASRASSRERAGRNEEGERERRDDNRREKEKPAVPEGEKEKDAGRDGGGGGGGGGGGDSKTALDKLRYLKKYLVRTDKNQTGILGRGDIKAICKKINLGLSSDVLDTLMDKCREGEGVGIKLFYDAVEENGLPGDNADGRVPTSQSRSRRRDSEPDGDADMRDRMVSRRAHRRDRDGGTGTDDTQPPPPPTGGLEEEDTSTYNNAFKMDSEAPPMERRSSMSGPSSRPTSSRPQSARPGPPRLRTSEVKKADDRMGTARGRKDQPTPSVAVKETRATAALITEGGGDDSDDEPVVVVQAAGEMGLDLPDDGGEHGKLVGDILKEQALLDEKMRAGEEDGGSGVILSRRNKRADGINYANEIEKLRNSLQALCQSTNPLGKCMDYLQEDVEGMNKEAENWRSEKARRTVELEESQRKTEESLEQYHEQLRHLDEQIKDQLSMINTVKANISKNDDIIHSLINMFVQRS